MCSINSSSDHRTPQMEKRKGKSAPFHWCYQNTSGRKENLGGGVGGGGGGRRKKVLPTIQGKKSQRGGPQETIFYSRVAR